MKEQNWWPSIFQVILDLRRSREREARRIEHRQSKRSSSCQSPQRLAIVCVMFSYNRSDRKKTFCSDRGDRNDRGGYMRTNLKECLWIMYLWGVRQCIWVQHVIALCQPADYCQKKNNSLLTVVIRDATRTHIS